MKFPFFNAESIFHNEEILVNTILSYRFIKCFYKLNSLSRVGMLSTLFVSDAFDLYLEQQARYIQRGLGREMGVATLART